MAEQSELLVAACGVFDCATCRYRTRGRCDGCAQGNALLAASGEEQCEVFACTRSRSIISCEECTEAVCPLVRHSEMVCPVRARFERKRCYAHKLSTQLSSRRPLGQDAALVSRKLDKAIIRLAWYLLAVQDFISHGVACVSSDDISRKVGVKPWLVRRDLSQFGGFGRPSVGYETSRLRECLSEIFRLDIAKSVVWVGAARIDADKSLMQRFWGLGCGISAVFDTDVSRAPEMIGGLRVAPVAELPRRIAELGSQGAVIATTADEAQGVADILVAAGIRGILNLTSTLIVAPPQVCVRNVNIAAELFALSYRCGQAHEEDVAEDRPGESTD